jgi:hypothetical protein
MKAGLRLAAVVLTVGFVATSCILSPQVSTAELEQVIRRDGVPFEGGAIPEEVLDRLASHKVVLVGETHFLHEHRELMIDLMRELHGRGYRQFMFEWTHLADWLLADFVEDGGLEPDWIPPLDIGGAMIIAIRDLNRTLPESERIRVHAIDITLDDYGGGKSFVGALSALARHLPDPGPLTALLEGDYSTPERQEDQLEALQAGLEAGRSELVASWWQHWYDTVVDLVEWEQVSVSIRAIRESKYDRSARMREDAIKQLVERRLEGYPHGTLINMGSTHAQKERLWGTDIEWMGDYLVNKSEAAGGSVIALHVSAAHTVTIPGSGIPDKDLSASPENELFRVMNQTWQDRSVFLPVDDPLFSKARVPINIDGTIYLGAPKRHYDAFIVLPVAHRERFEQ